MLTLQQLEDKIDDLTMEVQRLEDDLAEALGIIEDKQNLIDDLNDKLVEINDVVRLVTQELDDGIDDVGC